MIEEDLHLEVLRLLEREPDMTQRQLARALG
ncbi:MAG: winged helix-turn-helix transcriptional regulator, partial [Pseudomonadota bacterium]